MKKSILSLIGALMLLKAAGASAQANQDLSNLTSPTAINQNLIFDMGTDAVLQTKDETAAISKNLSLLTGDTQVAETDSGHLTIGTGWTVGSGISGMVQIYTGTTGAGDSGQMITRTGDAFGAGNTGGYTIATGTNSGSGNSGEIAIVTGAADSGNSGNISLTISGTNSGVRGHIILDGHIHTAGLAPTLGTCGTSPSIAGNDVAGRITVGSGGASSCTFTFRQAWTNAPLCFVSDETAAIAMQIVPTTTTLTITGASSFSASTKLAYHCVGYQ